MTRYELRAIGRMVYSAAILVCDCTAALVMAATETDAGKARELVGKADEARRALVLEYRGNGGSLGDAGERGE